MVNKNYLGTYSLTSTDYKTSDDQNQSELRLGLVVNMSVHHFLFNDI